MRICMIVEGSYPYIVGGVSSWVQMLISQMPEHEFIIYSIASEEKERGNFCYTLPENVVAVEEVFLDSILHSRGGLGQVKLGREEAFMLECLISGEGPVEARQLKSLFYKEGLLQQKRTTALDLFMSFDFFDVVCNVYKKKYFQLPFTDFFWTIRSILLPLLYLVEQKLPQADLYHSVSAGYAGVVGALAAQIQGRALLLTEHGIYAREREEEIIQSNWAGEHFKSLWIGYFYSLARMVYREAAQVLTLFRQNAEMERFLGCEESKIEIVPNGVNSADYCMSGEGQSDGYTVGAVVRVVPIKDILTMLRAFAIVNREERRSHFYIIGPTEENPDYFAQCKNLQTALQLESVVFTGVADVREFFPKLDIMVLSSISEGQPLAILEGMAAGKPFVTTDVGACRELLLSEEDGLGPAGMVVPMLDAELMAQNILQLLRQPELRKTYGENGCKRVKAHYERRSMIQRYREMYAQWGAKYGRDRL